ncbi:hypothetical protein [Laribacter hongkongensis]|uniref:hypothetical protein n=2 Tax=Laribacter hongkongensis TaxID=168471 RepID=UPI001EFECEDE|nr:hypothetical protein [Laribacter hongkongensis]MCG8998719.1 hypothetical protein [Laribacter hongkongensis]MCG9006597.1 hypothetical protein [Laribacter hongkongensis]MCG9015733.1 hypothetical protein [Laribacter hongkongensis]
MTAQVIGLMSYSRHAIRMDVTTIRRANLRRLASRYPSLSAFADALDMDAGLLSRLIGINANKPVGNKLASRIECILGLPPGALSSVAFDIDPDGQLVTRLMSAPHDVQRLIVDILSRPMDSDTAAAFRLIVSRLGN